MGKDEILAMEPGRELDTLVAEKIFGLEYIECIGCYIDSNGNEQKIQRHSTGIADAWKIVEKIREKGLNIYIYVEGDNYTVEICDPIKDMSSMLINVKNCNTAQEAICKAALLAVMEA